MTKSTFFVEEDKILTTLFEEGMDAMHLYKPQSEPVYSERLLTLIPEEYYRRITVHDHFYLREEYGLAQLSKTDFEALDPASVVGARRSPYGVSAILRRSDAPAGVAMEPVSIEDLFILMVKGEGQ